MGVGPVQRVSTFMQVRTAKEVPVDPGHPQASARTNVDDQDVVPVEVDGTRLSWGGELVYLDTAGPEITASGFDAFGGSSFGDRSRQDGRQQGREDRQGGGGPQPEVRGTPVQDAPASPPSLLSQLRDLAGRAPGLNIVMTDGDGRRLVASGPEVKPLSRWERLRNFFTPRD